MTAIHWVVVTGLLFGAHYICHQAAREDVGAAGDPPLSAQTPISSESTAFKKRRIKSRVHGYQPEISFYQIPRRQSAFFRILA